MKKGNKMIRITGDTHGQRERFEEFSKKFDEANWTKNDCLIVCGDFGYIFFESESEKEFLNELEKKPYTIAFVDGNHENFAALERFPVELFCGGKVHRIRKNIVHLMRGQVFDFEGKKFFAMGGAYSIDRSRRMPGVSWWPEEQPKSEEYKEAVENLRQNNMTVDYVITHNLPREMIRRFGKYPDAHEMELTGFLEWIMYEVKYKHWYCGHWHEDVDLENNITILQNEVRVIEE